MKLQILIIILSFIIILWFQKYDDKKYNKKRLTFYDKYKFPLLVSSIIGLILTFQNNVKLNNAKQITEQQIFTDLPDF